MARSRKDSVLPKYLELKGKLLEELSGGGFRRGDRFHSEAAVCRRHGAALLTVRRAYALLESEGYLRREHGSGTFVRKLPENLVRQKVVQSCMVGLYLDASRHAPDLAGTVFVEALGRQLNAQGMAVTLLYDSSGVAQTDGLDGLVFFGTAIRGEVAKIRALGLPTVALGASRVENFPGVCQKKDFLRQVFLRFLRKGRRRIALLNFGAPPDLNAPVRPHLDNAIAEFGAGERLELSGGRNELESRLAAALTEPRAPDALFLPSWTYVPGTMVTLERLNLKLGMEVGAFTGFCPDMLLAGLPAHAAHPMETQAEIVVGMLARMLREPGYKGEIIEHEPEILNQEAF